MMVINNSDLVRPVMPSSYKPRENYNSRIRKKTRNDIRNQEGFNKTISVDLKMFAMIHPESSLRPFHGLGCKCISNSKFGFLTPLTTNLGLRNLLLVPTSNPNNYFFTRYCSYIFYCLRLNVNFRYPNLTNKAIMNDERVQDALKKAVNDELEETSSQPQRYAPLLSQYCKKVVKILNDMKTALSSTLIRVTGYVLFKVFNYLFMSVTVTEGQLRMIQDAAKKEVPLIFVPLHRSHVDYLFVTWVLFNREIPAPIVAAGDNLRMPVFGCLLRGLGGFFIKRKLETQKTRKDFLYRAVLQTYMTHALREGYNLEFFIEGGRTRTGKPCMPKGGLLSVIVDAFLNGTLEDALIVPIAINYDKIVDGNFIREQLGQNKVPESFWRAVRAIIKVLSTSFGHSRIDFSRPFSLKEFFHNSKIFSKHFPALSIPESAPEHQTSESPRGHQRSYSTPLINSTSSTPHISFPGSIYPTKSTSSLFGTDVTDDYRQFVKVLGAHIVYDAESCQAIMSTNAVAWLLSFLYREGTTLACLSEAMDNLRGDLRIRDRDVGFSGTSLDATIHAVFMLGASLITIKGDPQGDPANVFVSPVVVLPNVIELNYYANALMPLYAVDCIVATSLVTLIDCDLWSYKDVYTDCTLQVSKLMDRSKRLCEILRNEFMFISPCGSLESRIQEAIERFLLSGLLVSEAESSNLCLKSKVYDRNSDDDSDESGIGIDVYYSLHPKSSNLQMLSTLTQALCPLIDTYYATVSNLTSLIASPIPDKDFVQQTQQLITTMLMKGMLLYGESIAADPIRNVLKLLESDGVLESYSVDSIRLVYLSKAHESEEIIHSFIKEIESYRI